MAARVQTFVLALIIGLAGTHLAWSAAMALALASSYPARMADTRRWPEEVPSVRMITEMVSMFISGQVRTSAATTVFFGSSVAYGFPWQEEVVVSSRYAALRPNEHVLNAAVVGNNLALLENGVLCGATNAVLQADVVIVELPVINSILFRLALDREGQLPAEHTCDETIGRVGSMWFAARHPIGAGWVSFIWDNKAYPKPDSTVELGTSKFATFASAGEFAPMEAELRRQVVVAMERAKTLGRRVYAFPSPVLIPGAQAMGFDGNAIRAQLAAALSACQTVPGVHCVDIESFYNRQDLYYNLTHLNQRGHQALAEWLADQIPPSRRER